MAILIAVANPPFDKPSYISTDSWAVAHGLFSFPFGKLQTGRLKVTPP